MNRAALTQALNTAIEALKSIARRTVDYTLGMHIADEVASFSRWLNELSQFTNALPWDQRGAMYRLLEDGFDALTDAEAHAAELMA